MGISINFQWSSAGVTGGTESTRGLHFEFFEGTGLGVASFFPKVSSFFFLFSSLYFYLFTHFYGLFFSSVVIARLRCRLSGRKFFCSAVALYGFRLPVNQIGEMTETDDDGDYGKLVTAQNRKQKKAGGWQAIG